VPSLWAVVGQEKSCRKGLPFRRQAAAV